MAKKNETLKVLDALIPAIKRIEGGWYSEVEQFVLTANTELEKVNSTFRFESSPEIKKTGLSGKFTGEFVHGLRVVDLSTQETMTPALAFAVAYCASTPVAPRESRPSPKDDPDAIIIPGSCPPAYLRGPRPDLAGSIRSDTSMLAAFRSDDLGLPDLDRAILVLFAVELSAQLGRPLESILNAGLAAGDFDPFAGVAFEFEDGSAGVFWHAFFLHKKDTAGADMFAVFAEHCGYRLFRGPGVVVKSIYRAPGGV